VIRKAISTALLLVLPVFAACEQEHDPESNQALGVASGACHSPPDAAPPDAAPPDAAPPDAAPPVPVVAPITATTHGKSYADWAIVWWQFVHAIPKSVNPTLGGDCTIGQSGDDVWFLAGNFGGAEVRSCQVPAHTALFFPVLNKICKQCPESSCAASHNSDLAVCASRGLELATDLFLEVDGVPLPSVAQQRVATLPFTWTAPANPADHVRSCLGPVPANSCGTPEGARFGQTDGYWIMLEPLPPGPHTIHFGGKLPAGTIPAFSLDMTYNLTVAE